MRNKPSTNASDHTIDWFCDEKSCNPEKAKRDRIVEQDLNRIVNFSTYQYPQDTVEDSCDDSESVPSPQRKDENWYHASRGDRATLGHMEYFYLIQDECQRNCHANFSYFLRSEFQIITYNIVIIFYNIFINASLGL